MKASLLGCLTSLFGYVSLSAKEELSYAAYDQKIRPFLETYCMNCHGEENQKGDRRFDLLTYPIVDNDALIDFQDMLDLLNLGDMPPEEKKQPSDEERQEVIDWLTQAVEHAYEERDDTPSETVLRRLNHREYYNTIRDLFQMDVSMFNPTESFPGERTIEHLDNVGEALVTSGYLLDKYIDAADAIVEKALEVPERPEAQKWIFNGDFKQQSELNSRHEKAHGQRFLNIYESPNSDLYFGSYAPLLAMEDGVPLGGYYDIKVKAEAVNRKHDFDRRRVPNDPNEPFIMRVVPGHRRFGKLHLPQPYEPDLGTFVMPDSKPEWFETRAWLDQGFSPRFSFPNGVLNIRRSYSEVEKTMKKRLGDEIPESDRRMDSKAFAIKYGVPHIRIHEVVIEGPYYDEWPTPSWKAIVGEEKFRAENTRDILERFAERAFRRPASDLEVDRLMRVVDSRMEEGHDSFEALKGGLKAALCSPAFLYMEEPSSSSADEQMSGYALASRLSYFLWSSMPDEELIDLARSEKISKPDVLKKQIHRMLQDSKSDAFVSGFLDSWLTLRGLGDTPPDRSKFSYYYEADLEPLMRQETELYARHTLDDNLPLTEFLDSNYSYLNESLAKLYGVKGVEGDRFRKVAFNDPRRGGLLGQASILTVTANGVDTSPVLRGIWLLENLLGTPPPPPPPDVEPLDPDIRGAKTIREQLMKHRNVASCNECHRKIDPPGFALENFDAIGQWRETYEEGGAVDASGSLPGTKEFHDIVGFKDILIDRQDQFLHAVTEKMLAYALGRRIQITDRPQIDRILDELHDRGSGFKDLVELVAMSESFARP